MHNLMTKRDAIPLLVFAATLALLTWSVRSPAAMSEPASVARPSSSAPHCSQALASRYGIRAAKRADAGPARAAERTCTSALRPRVA
jgi:hypothetical protein